MCDMIQPKYLMANSLIHRESITFKELSQLRYSLMKSNKNICVEFSGDLILNTIDLNRWMFTPIKNGFKRADQVKDQFTQKNIDIGINYDLNPRIAEKIKGLCKQQFTDR